MPDSHDFERFSSRRFSSSGYTIAYFDKGNKSGIDIVRKRGADSYACRLSKTGAAAAISLSSKAYARRVQNLVAYSVAFRGTELAPFPRRQYI